MKLWVMVFLVLLLPSVYAVEISIPELFTIEQTITPESNKEIYFYTGQNLVASFDDELKYQYQNRLTSDGESKTLPFGQPILTENRFSFTGKELDSDLYYFNARYYSPELGKFISVDPVQSELSYTYVANNPLNLIDPDGRRLVHSGGSRKMEELADQINELFGVEVVSNVWYMSTPDGKLHSLKTEELFLSPSSVLYEFSKVDRGFSEDQQEIYDLIKSAILLEDYIILRTGEGNQAELKFRYDDTIRGADIYLNEKSFTGPLGPNRALYTASPIVIFFHELSHAYNYVTYNPLGYSDDLAMDTEAVVQRIISEMFGTKLEVREVHSTLEIFMEGEE